MRTSSSKISKETNRPEDSKEHELLRRNNNENDSAENDSTSSSSSNSSSASRSTSSCSISEIEEEDSEGSIIRSTSQRRHTTDEERSSGRCTTTIATATATATAKEKEKATTQKSIRERRLLRSQSARVAVSSSASVRDRRTNNDALGSKSMHTPSTEVSSSTEQKSKTEDNSVRRQRSKRQNPPLRSNSDHSKLVGGTTISSDQKTMKTRKEGEGTTTTPHRTAAALLTSSSPTAALQIMQKNNDTEFHSSLGSNSANTETDAAGWTWSLSSLPDPTKQSSIETVTAISKLSNTRSARRPMTARPGLQRSKSSKVGGRHGSNRVTRSKSSELFDASSSHQHDDRSHRTRSRQGARSRSVRRSQSSDFESSSQHQHDGSHADRTTHRHRNRTGARSRSVRRSQSSDLVDLTGGRRMGRRATITATPGTGTGTTTGTTSGSRIRRTSQRGRDRSVSATSTGRPQRASPGGGAANRRRQRSRSVSSAASMASASLSASSVEDGNGGDGSIEDIVVPKRKGRRASGGTSTTTGGRAEDSASTTTAAVLPQKSRTTKTTNLDTNFKAMIVKPQAFTRENLLIEKQDRNEFHQGGNKDDDEDNNSILSNLSESGLSFASEFEWKSWRQSFKGTTTDGGKSAWDAFLETKQPTAKGGTEPTLVEEDEEEEIPLSGRTDSLNSNTGGIDDHVETDEEKKHRLIQEIEEIRRRKQERNPSLHTLNIGTDEDETTGSRRRGKIFTGTTSVVSSKSRSSASSRKSKSAKSTGGIGGHEIRTRRKEKNPSLDSLFHMGVEEDNDETGRQSKDIAGTKSVASKKSRSSKSTSTRKSTSAKTTGGIPSSSSSSGRVRYYRRDCSVDDDGNVSLSKSLHSGSRRPVGTTSRKHRHNSDHLAHSNFPRSCSADGDQKIRYVPKLTADVMKKGLSKSVHNGSTSAGIRATSSSSVGDVKMHSKRRDNDGLAQSLHVPNSRASLTKSNSARMAFLNEEDDGNKTRTKIKSKASGELVSFPKQTFNRFNSLFSSNINTHIDPLGGADSDLMNSFGEFSFAHETTTTSSSGLSVSGKHYNDSTKGWSSTTGNGFKEDFATDFPKVDASVTKDDADKIIKAKKEDKNKRKMKKKSNRRHPDKNNDDNKKKSESRRNRSTSGDRCADDTIEGNHMERKQKRRTNCKETNQNATKVEPVEFPLGFDDPQKESGNDRKKGSVLINPSEKNGCYDDDFFDFAHNSWIGKETTAPPPPSSAVASSYHRKEVVSSTEKKPSSTIKATRSRRISRNDSNDIITSESTRNRRRPGGGMKSTSKSISREDGATRKAIHRRSQPESTSMDDDYDSDSSVHTAADDSVGFILNLEDADIISPLTVAPKIVGQGLGHSRRRR